MKDITLSRVKITENMVGKECLITPDAKILNQLQYGELYAGGIRTKIKPRSVRQHRLLFAAFKMVLENKGDDPNWNTLEKVKEQIKIKIRFVETYYYYENKILLDSTNNIRSLLEDLTIDAKIKAGILEELEKINWNGKTLNIKTKSISFEELEQEEANQVFDDMINECCNQIGCTWEEFEELAKKRTNLRKTCSFCGGEANQKHHIFPNTKANVEKYGRKLINMDFNKKAACENCNPGHASPELSKNWIYTEFQFDKLILQQENSLKIINKIKDDFKKEELLRMLKIKNIKEKFEGDIIK